MSIQKLAKISLILGLLSGVLGFLTAIPSIICGHIYLYRIKGKPTETEIDGGNKRMAVGGLIFGYLGFILWIVMMILFWKIFKGIH